MKHSNRQFGDQFSGFGRQSEKFSLISACIRRNFTPWFIFIHKGLFACRWGTSGRLGTPPNRGRLHLYLMRSLRDRKHQEAEICQCCETFWADVIIYFLFCLWIKPFWSRFNKVRLGFLYIFSSLLRSANDWNFVRLLVCL